MADEKKDKSKEKSLISIPAKEEESDNLNLPEEEANVITSDTDNWIQDVKVQRERLNLNAEWSEGRDQYYGVTEYKDFPFENCSNLYIMITYMSVEILRIKARRQMFSVPPAMILKALPDATPDEVEGLKTKEKWLDDEARRISKISYYVGNDILRDAINLGTGITKLIYEKNIGRRKRYEFYDGSLSDDTMHFEEDFERQKGNKIYNENYAKLKNGERIRVAVEYPAEIFNGVRTYYTPVEKLYLMPEIPELRLQRVIPEELTYTWQELKEKEREGIFDAKTLRKIEEEESKGEGESKEYKKKTYPVWDVIYQYDYNNDGYSELVLITYLQDDKTKILRQKKYQYFHGTPCYNLHYIKPRQDRIYGDGLARMLKDGNIQANNLWNQTVDAGTMGNAPAFKAVKGAAKIGSPESFDPQIKKYGPATIWWLTNIGDVDTFDVKGISPEMPKLIEMTMRFSEYVSGVSAYMSGRESPLDPNAPASKAMMLLQESNLRVDEAIQNLHQCNIGLWEQLDGLLNQYRVVQADKKNETVSFFDYKNKVVTISPKIMAIPCEYVPQLSTITINKGLEKEQNIEFLVFLQKYAPELFNNPVIKRILLEVVFRSWGGEWDKYIDQILPPEEVVQQERAEALKQAAVEILLKKLGINKQAGLPGTPLPPRVFPPVPSISPGPQPGGNLPGIVSEEMVTTGV